MVAHALSQPTARGKQVATGASQIYGCRAEAVLRLNEIPATDTRVRLDAENGNAIHAWVEARLQAAFPGLLVEQRWTYRGVPATLDLPLLTERRVVDIKTKANAAKISLVRRYGPSARNRAQVHLGAAAAIAAGHEIDAVELLYLPRDGEIDDAWSWSEPFSRQVADEAADWAHATDALARERAGTEVSEMVDGLRDEPPAFCWRFCAYASTCRGPRPAVIAVDADAERAAREYLDARTEEQAAAARAAEARRVLETYADLRPVGLQWVGGSERKVQEVDLDLVRFLLGDLPTRTVTKTSARQLRRL